MDTDEDLTGKLARLPDGQLVRVETVHPDGYATVIRVEGEYEGMMAVCAIKSLNPETD